LEVDQMKKAFIRFFLGGKKVKEGGENKTERKKGGGNGKGRGGRGVQKER